MPEEVLTVVRVPIAEIEESLRIKHTLPKVLIDVRIDQDSLVFSFSDEKEYEERKDTTELHRVRRRRRAHRRRNRMKTRGWEIVARMTNSSGQKCAIYRPFVEALQNPELGIEEQKAAIARILKSNRNRPSETSIQYFLQNTLEYLRNKEKADRQGKE